MSGPNYNIDSSLINLTHFQVDIDYKNLINDLDELRTLVLLLKRNEDMELKYPTLKKLKDDYNKELDKLLTWERIQ